LSVPCLPGKINCLLPKELRFGGPRIRKRCGIAMSVGGICRDSKIEAPMKPIGIAAFYPSPRRGEGGAYAPGEGRPRMLK